MTTPDPYIKTFKTEDSPREKPEYEAEVWLDIEGIDKPVSIHTTKPATRETTAERRAEAWIKSDEGIEALHLELVLLGAEA